MCWSIEVSFGSCLVGWAACLFLKWRQRSERDDYYARYLVTFTFTQLVDIALWKIHASTEPYGLRSCTGLQLQSWRFPGTDDPQFFNFMISKFLLPAVVFSQHAMQCTYPSQLNNAPGQRKRMILKRLIPVAVMSFAFACTMLVPSPYDHSHVESTTGPKYTAYDGTQTLHWGGDFSHKQMMQYIPGFVSFIEPWISARMTWIVIQVAACAHSGLVAYDFTQVMPERVAFVHNLVLACVVGTLAATEGTIQLGSKWCTYCLVYSFVYVAEPLWMPAELHTKAEALTSPNPKESPSPSPVKSPVKEVEEEVQTRPSPTGYRGTGHQLRSRKVY